MESAPPRRQQPGVHVCTFPLRIIIISGHEGSKSQPRYLKCDAPSARRPRLRGQGTSATLVQIIEITQTLERLYRFSFDERLFFTLSTLRQCEFISDPILTDVKIALNFHFIRHLMPPDTLTPKEVT